MAEGVPLGELALVQAHAHRVVLLHRLVEHALHVAVRTERLLDVALAAELGGELDLVRDRDRARVRVRVRVRVGVTGWGWG